MEYKNRAENLTVLVPAYNETKYVADTIKSIQNQTTPPKEIIVVDDFSSDNTGDVARSRGVTVLRPPQNTGSKAGAQNFALKEVKTKYVMAIDADTTLAPDAIEKLMHAFDNLKVAAACGTVIPRRVKTLWERGRYIEYLFAFTFYKPIQDFFGKPLISSGCFSAYRTTFLRGMGGWSTRTLAEDMDLTWSLYSVGHKVRFVPEAVCYPVEPHNFEFMKKQLKRWSHGFAQNVRLHWKEVLGLPYLRSMLSVGVLDAIIVSLAYLVLIPALTLIFKNPIFLLAYFIDLPAILFPVVVKGMERKELGKVLSSIPSFFVLRVVNCVFILEAFWSEFVMGRSLNTYEKGH